MQTGWARESRVPRVSRPITYTLCSCLLTLGCDPTPDTRAGASDEFPTTPLIGGAVSDAGLFSVDLFTAPEQPPSAGVVAVQLRVKTTAQQALSENLKIDMAPIMPSMGHGTSEVPAAKAMGSGRYVFSSVDLFMPGRWDLVTQISGTEDDTLTFSVDVR